MFEGVFMRKSIVGLQNLFSGVKIDKITQPKKKIIELKLSKSNCPFKYILISTEPNSCSIHLSDIKLENPLTPSTFVMILRKYLEGGTILSIEQIDYDRFIRIEIEKYNEIGKKTIKVLHLELMGKYSNIILTENDIIIDSLHKYPIGVNGFREILPKREYVLPPLTSHLNLDEVNLKQITTILEDADCENIKLSTILSMNITGTTKGYFKEIFSKNSIADSYIYTDIPTLSHEIFEILLKIKKYVNTYDLTYIEEYNRKFNGLMLEKNLSIEKRKYSAILNKKIAKINKKIAIYEDNIKIATTCEKYKIKGELLLANIYKLKNIRGASVKVYNYYEDKIIEISLDPKLDLTKNAQKYYKRYHKLKEAKVHSEIFLRSILNERIYFQTILAACEMADVCDDFKNISDELTSLGLIKEKKLKKKKQSEVKPRTFDTSTGFTCYYGKNNKENDYITFKFAKNQDLWFHVKDFPGAHLIIKYENDRPFDYISIMEAAKKTAEISLKNKFFSIDVDYTTIKNVKRHPSRFLGNATYSNFKTVFIKEDNND